MKKYLYIALAALGMMGCEEELDRVSSGSGFLISLGETSVEVTTKAASAHRHQTGTAPHLTSLSTVTTCLAQCRQPRMACPRYARRDMTTTSKPTPAG